MLVELNQKLSWKDISKRLGCCESAALNINHGYVRSTNITILQKMFVLYEELCGPLPINIVKLKPVVNVPVIPKPVHPVLVPSKPDPRKSATEIIFFRVHQNLKD
jgi:hypothetical protein